MKTVCLVLFVFSCLLPAVLSDGHLVCPVESACPVSTPPVSAVGTGTCDESLRSTISDDTTSVLNGNIAKGNEYFNRVGQRYIGQAAQFSAVSCAQILTTFPGSTSGYYWVGGRRAYCRFDLVSPGDTAWERVLNIDFGDPSCQQSCPDVNFRLVEPPEARGRYCVKRTSDEGCEGFTFSPATAVFNRVYGRVIGIQIGSANVTTAGKDINEDYLDGVSLTTLNEGERQHIWSFMAYAADSVAGCPCSTDTVNPETLDFVGDDYFCESGTSISNVEPTQAFPEDPLWDGMQCGGLEVPCCIDRSTGGLQSPPWFYKEFETAVPSGSNLDLRICAHTDNGSIGLQAVELYVQ